MAGVQPPEEASGAVRFDVEQLATMAVRIDEAAALFVARYDAEMEEGDEPGQHVIAHQTYDLLDGHYGHLVTQFNNVLREAKREVPEPFILAIPEAPPGIHLKLLPVYSAQLAERLRALSRLKAKSYQKWQQFIDEVRLASRTASEPGSFVDRNREALKKLSDR